ncbi:MAG: class I SAM-dependent methyltransferase [Phycisphaerae bacterium]|nr:class I SAM-dependent methyltransferase [Phycisphaerae bacterium]
MSDMTRYYAERAPEYERIYERPERQEDLRTLEAIVSDVFLGRHVLEIACGTGYWTRFAARSAASILATDANDEVLNLAQGKDYGTCRVAFAKSDACALGGASGPFSAGLVAFWWSHVPRQDLPRFLDGFHAKLEAGSPVLVIDNVYAPGSSTPISRTDEHGNTYQIRRLADGSTHEVLKNFPDEAEFTRCLQSVASRSEFTRLTYYWLGRYVIAEDASRGV